jgi:hypothetical protein
METNKDFDAEWKAAAMSIISTAAKDAPLRAKFE